MFTFTRYVCNETCCAIKLYYDLASQLLDDIFCTLFSTNRTGL